MSSAPKRKRRAPPSTNAPQENLLKRYTFAKSNTPGRWSWIDTEVSRVEEITREHQLTAYGLTAKSGYDACLNKYLVHPGRNQNATNASPVDCDQEGDDNTEIVVISDEEDSSKCSKKSCKSNPRCLNYMGQEIWENQAKVKAKFKKLVHSDNRDDPNLQSREPDVPVGLRVWFRDIAFRNGVYHCQIPEDGDDRLKDSPIFQLQVTFAALQKGKGSVFNPSKLVESLQLRTSEQQDAQEFSKLFMSHLDAEFKKQNDEAVRMLIESQFQGSQVYGTFCHACQYKSERSADFLEVEVAFDAPSKLEDRIAASLEPEVLSGDNKYHCPKCDCLQDATRYTELRQLPPVLHFSLLRFVYNLQTMERKKQKHSISFPTVLDMNRFLGGQMGSSASTADTGSRREDSVYELRGILLHKGSSAYHGHYEAQVYDTELTSWFQFNDESVTRIPSLVAKPKQAKDKTENLKDKRNRPKKRRRIEDSSDEDSPAPEESRPQPEPEMISSKDAYMLVYARKGYEGGATPRDPPASALRVVEELNDAHEKSCEKFEQENDLVEKEFNARLHVVQQIYKQWQPPEVNEDSVVLSEQGLRNWLSDCWCANIKAHPAEKSVPEAKPLQSISNASILCEHNKLDPTKSNDMKVISRSTYQAIVDGTACEFDPLLSVRDTCEACVVTEAKEKLYEAQHTRYVQQFEQIERTQDEDHEGFWISKLWLRDWKLNKPRMHVHSEEDPPPDGPKFRDNVLCEHDQLTPNASNRRKISKEAKGLLTSLFPSWQPPPADAETCAVCEVLVSTSKEDKRELRKKAEEERSKLKHMNSMTYAFFSGSSPSCAIIPSKFYRSWKRWVDSPAAQPRPEAVDNSQFLCDSHSMLLYDPNLPDEIEGKATIIRREEWDELITFYTAGPLIALGQNTEGKFESGIPICSDCRTKRQKQWDVTDIVVQLGPAGKDTATKPLRSNGSRQSTRLRKKQGDRRKISVQKHTSVKDMKIMISEVFEIPTICQKLILRGTELDDNEATAESLDILANDVLELHQIAEEVDIDADSDAGSGSAKPRDEGRGFNGTVLGGGGGMMTDSSMPSSRATSPDPLLMQVEKSCSACTFMNSVDAIACEICGTIFE